MSPRISVVIATRQRCATLAHTLQMLSALPDSPELLVVDNASTDGTDRMVRQDYPHVTLIRLDRNRAAAGRNAGVVQAGAECVAFSDDDSWWVPGALDRAADLFDRHPRLGALTGRTLVGATATEDPIVRDLAASPLPRAEDLPGPSVLGFLACSTVVRRSAFLGVGGFDPMLGVGGEETLLAYDLTAAGWGVAFVPEVVARHVPAPGRDPAARQAVMRRNEVLTCWLRRPVRRALAGTWRLTRSARHDPVSRRACAQLAVNLPRALARRRPVPAAVERQIRLLDGGVGA